MLRQVFAARSNFIEKLQLRLTSDVLDGSSGNRQHTAHRRIVGLPELTSECPGVRESLGIVLKTLSFIKHFSVQFSKCTGF